MSGYFGTIVVARPDGRLVEQDGVAGFGHRHRWLRELSDGWQLTEVTGYDDPPDLPGPCAATASSTGHPVFAAYVSDGRCAVVCTAVPGRPGSLAHLWPVSTTCGIYRHQPRDAAEPVGRTSDEVTAELASWSAAAGLPADPDRLRRLIALDAGRAHGQADDLVFELVQALGLRRIGPAAAWSLPVLDWPFSSVMFDGGPVFQARANARYRAAGVAEIPPEQPWEAEAPALEAELWASLYRPGVEVAALARRAADVLAAYSGSATDDEARLRLLARLESRLDGGSVPPWSDEGEQRRYADARATP